MNQKLIEALSKLDPNVAEHWTADGLPRLDAVKSFYGSDVSRDDINTAVKGFHKTNLTPLQEILDAGKGNDTSENLGNPGDTDPTIHQGFKTDAAGNTTQTPVTPGAATLPPVAHTAQFLANASDKTILESLEVDDGEETLDSVNEKITRLEQLIHSAKNELERTYARRDELVAEDAPSASEASQTFSSTVKDYQDAQARQREKKIETDKKLQDFLNQK